MEECKTLRPEVTGELAGTTGRLAEPAPDPVSTECSSSLGGVKDQSLP
jgi:hypothetical protein